VTVGAPVPPGWPPAVRPPGSPDWQRTAVEWLFDLCPPDYRGHPVLRRHPLALATLARHHVRGSWRACGDALAAARAELSGDLDARTLDELLEALDAERARLLAAGRAVGLVIDALRGLKYVPRL
jgi:hypothetical protein